MDRWKSVARPPLSRAYLWGARVMSHRKRESLPLRNARHGRKVCASVRACVRACTRRESCVARANADLTYCACACAAESFRRSIEAIARQPHRLPSALILWTTLRASVDTPRALEEARKAEQRCNRLFAYDPRSSCLSALRTESFVSLCRRLILWNLKI